MKHYIVYHNPDKMGFDANDITGFSVQTTKRVREAKGATVWVITGRGHPRKYTLVQSFVVDKVTRVGDTVAYTVVSGGVGVNHDQSVILNDLAWFRRFIKTMGNFGLGFQLLTNNDYAEHLAQIPAATIPAGVRRRLAGTEKAAPLPPTTAKKPNITHALTVSPSEAEAILIGGETRLHRSRPTRNLERVWIYAGGSSEGDVDMADVADADVHEDAAAAAVTETDTDTDTDPTDKGVRPEPLALGMVVGSIQITACKWDERAAAFAYSLKEPAVLEQPRQVSNDPQPLFWKPNF